MTAKRISHPSIRVDLKQPIAFEFDGKSYQGFQGDTLASALLVNGIKHLARSFKYGRARGIMAAGAEEPNALVQLEQGAHATPNVKATQAELYNGLTATRTSGWPSLDFDVKSILGTASRMMPAGFYSKTFKWPQKFWPMYENVIRKFAGFGSAPTVPETEWYDHLHHHVDVLVVGGGVSGLLAALHAGQAGRKTLLVDEQPELGGWMLSDPHSQIDGLHGVHYVDYLQQQLSLLPHVQVKSRTTAFGLYDHNTTYAVELCQDHLPIHARNPQQPRHRLHKIKAAQIILATGAIERPLVFGNNDLPGVMTVSAVQTYLNRYGVLVGERVVLCGNNDEIYRAARDLAQHGAQVTVLDTRAAVTVPDDVPRTVHVYMGYSIVKVQGRKHVTGVTIMPMAGGATQDLSADIVASSGGQSPTVHLYCHDNGRPTWDESAIAFVVPATFAQCKQGVACVGAVTGAFEWAQVVQQTTQVMQDFLGMPLTAPTCNNTAVNPPELIVRLPDGQIEGAGAKAFVDYQNDVTAADIELSVRENYQHIESVKRYTAFGFGTDQGKLTSVNSFILTARALKVSPAQVSTTTYRPAYTPVSFGALAGSMRGDTFDPTRTTAIHAAHVSRGALMEPVGQWLRPWYFPKGGEDIHAAVNRECLATRNSVGVMDASTLGKIQIDGPHAREFLNRIYSNAWMQLGVGKCRYGLMLDENGMVMDDGVTACINEQQFYMTTTTGGAARILNWLERWHQTEWPDLQVWFTSVTDHWSTIALVGPNSRAVLAKLTDDIDLSPETFKFMDWRAGTVAGLPSRVFRVSFSGEMAYEINVESGYAHYVWEQVMAAGAEFDITPYGTETMHVLRAEKGFIIVGQDTDGSMSPIDLGMSWAVGLKKPFSFLGKRSLSRSDTARAGRKQLVGLLPVDPQAVLVEGAQIVASNEVKVPLAGSHDAPVEMLGHVTSSYYSAFLGRSIAMAVVFDGANKVGQTLYAYAKGQFTPVVVAEGSVFVDVKGERQHA
ncbi:MAG: sarcosine oxidase subunit alpha family protein [Formosimonas sp.]